MSDIANFFEKQGVKVTIADRSYPDVYDITRSITAYSHEKTANGGDWSATITINVPYQDLDTWIYKRIGNFVYVYNAFGQLRWAGVINKVTIRMASVTLSVGEYLNIANRVSATYTPINYNVTPPTVGTATETPIGNDTTSQNRYGIIEKIISLGQCTHNEALYARDIFLKENARPHLSISNNVSGVSNEPITATLECIGLVVYGFKTWIYNSFSTSVISISDKIKAICQAEVNVNNAQGGDITTGANLNAIETNSYLVPAQETKNRYAWDILLGLANTGDASNNRWIIGMYPNGMMYYRNVNSIPVTYEFIIHRERQEYLLNDSKQRILPYDIDPGTWLQLNTYANDTLPDFVNLYTDDRFAFIETVRYTAPYSLEITSDRFGKFPQLLAKMSNSGGLQ
jgi:hypothetical protein